MEQNEAWVFDCPIHGWETQVFCFRAYDTDLIDRWQKYRVTWEPLKTTRAEREMHHLAFGSDE